MGNESSHLNGLEIEEKAIEVTDFWAHYRATIKDSCLYFSLKGDGSVSVFKGDAVQGPLWAISTPLEKCSNNLLKYRHPCIVRYISAWQQRSTLHLATEYVQPLASVLTSQTPLQICVGLNDILRALVFLHEQAGMSHNNVSLGAIYVTGDGHWKLGGLQYLCSFKELTPSYLKHARIHRYDKAVDPNEDSNDIVTKVDQYGFAILVEDVFKGRNNDDVPHLRDFKKYCSEILLHQNPATRPQLSAVLQHSFFNHQFILIYKFLYFLPLKAEDEKMEFFLSVLEKLRCFDEGTVAKQLGGLLLSRLALLDQTARKELIPYILKPRNDRVQHEDELGLFSLSVFKEHVKPRLMQLFGVRDSQIRLLLLLHFTKYVHVFTHEELSQHILPELLLGIKDTDDNLVASTLVCLSELVPILGASTVIGGKRNRIFTDGRPNQNHSIRKTDHSHNSVMKSKPLKDFICSEEISQDSSDSVQFDKRLNINERPSPVGGESFEEEVKTSTTDIPSGHIIMESEDNWSDWDTSRQLVNAETNDLSNIVDNIDNISASDVQHSMDTKAKTEKADSKTERTTLLHNAAVEAKRNIIDISELDIKTQKNDYSKKGGGDEFDFFADMTPVIEKPTVVNIESESSDSKNFSKLNFVPNETSEENNGGWGDDWSE